MDYFAIEMHKYYQQLYLQQMLLEFYDCKRNEILFLELLEREQMGLHAFTIVRGRLVINIKILRTLNRELFNIKNLLYEPWHMIGKIYSNYDNYKYQIIIECIEPFHELLMIVQKIKTMYNVNIFLQIIESPITNANIELWTLMLQSFHVHN